MSTPKNLHELIETELQGVKFIVVSNREPYIHDWKDGVITCGQPARRAGHGDRPDHTGIRWRVDFPSAAP